MIAFAVVAAQYVGTVDAMVVDAFTLSLGRRFTRKAHPKEASMKALMVIT